MCPGFLCWMPPQQLTVFFAPKLPELSGGCNAHLQSNGLLFGVTDRPCFTNHRDLDLSWIGHFILYLF